MLIYGGEQCFKFVGQPGKINLVQIAGNLGKILDQFRHSGAQRRHDRIFSIARFGRCGELLRVEKIQFHKLQTSDADQINLGAQTLVNQPLQRGAIRQFDQAARSIRNHVLVQLGDHDDL